MGRGSVNEERRGMLFEDAYDFWVSGRLTQEQAAELLGVCPRTFRRWAERWEEDGLDGLRDRRVSGAAHPRLTVAHKPLLAVS